MDREQVLGQARECVCEEREEEYGSPEDNFNTIGNLWASYIEGAHSIYVPISATDVAVMLALVKIARIASGHAKADNWIDLAGYAACGGELESEGSR